MTSSDYTKVAHPPIEYFGAWLFDMDGVLTRTALVHATAWKQAFDEFLRRESIRTGRTYQPFDKEGDYEKYVDGEPREDGVRHFLAARGITLPEGDAGDTLDDETVKGVGNYKNSLVGEVIATQGVKVYEGAVTLIHQLRAWKKKVAVVSASENTVSALKSAGILDLFDARVDGLVVKAKNLKGKPAPDSYEEGARLVKVAPSLCVVVEDALAGVQAGRAGNFGLVVGVDNHDTPRTTSYADQLKSHGADIVVTDLSSLLSK